MKAEEAFPRGTPFQFSFECTYRERQKQSDSWHLFHLTNAHEEPQLSVTLNPVEETLQVSLPDAEGDLQTVEFRHASVSAHKVHEKISLQMHAFNSYSINVGTRSCSV